MHIKVQITHISKIYFHSPERAERAERAIYILVNIITFTQTSITQ